MVGLPRRFVAAVAVVVTVSCADLDDRTPAHALPQWELCDAPEAVVGRAGSTELFRVTGALFTASGELLVANEGSSELLFFDRKGALRRREGGRGDGPGEFASLRLIPDWSSDSVVVFDRQRQRVSVLDSHGRFGRSVRMLSETGAPFDIRVEVLGRMRAGHFLVRTFLPRTIEGPGIVRSQATLALHGVDGRADVELGIYAGDETLFAEYEGVRITSLLPFLGRLIAAAGPSHAFVSQGRSLEITRASAGDIGPARFRGQPRPRTVNWEGYTAWVEQELQSIHNPAAREATRKYYHHIYSPWELQAVDRMFVDDSERVWAGSEWFRESPEWLVLDRDLQPVATLQVPARFRLLHVREMEVIGLAKDELGRERIEVRCMADEGGMAGSCGC